MMIVETSRGKTELWIAAEITNHVEELLAQGNPVHANCLYRYVEQDGPDIPSEKLYMFVATEWKGIKERLEARGLIVARGEDAAGAPCYVAGQDGDTINVLVATYKLW